MQEPTDRLDSWKSIAEYLGRDVRTVRRWEAQGLPVNRVSGLPGNSVFSYKSEIDAWLRERAKQPAPVPGPGHARTESAPPANAVYGVKRRLHPGVRPLAAAVVVLAIFFGWKAFAPSSAEQFVSVGITEAGVVATDSAGVEKWRFEFPLDARNVLPFTTQPNVVLGGPKSEIYAASSFLLRRPDDLPMSGVLRALSIDGKLQRTFVPDDVWAFTGRQFAAPWGITDFRVHDSFGRRQIAVAVHHYTWWPSFVTVLDERFQRTATFVHSGWAEAVRWISPDQLAIAGFNEALDGGMFGVLDTHDLDGASPEVPGSKFECDGCRSGRPLFYAVFPRSEVNRIGGGPFNRASIDVSSDGLTIHTSEDKSEANVGLTEAVYDFAADFQLKSATYGSRYWDRHRALELEGKLKHSRQQCPDRDGPPLIKTWTRATGWRDLKLRK